MKYEFETVIDGIANYIDKEIYSGMNDLQELMARLVVGRVIERQEEIKTALTKNGIIRTFGVIDTEGHVDIDSLFKDLKREIERKGKLTISIPMLGKMTFNANDVDIIKEYIIGDR